MSRLAGNRFLLAIQALAAAAFRAIAPDMSGFGLRKRVYPTEINVGIFVGIYQDAAIIYTRKTSA